jgi:glutamate-1-semialdehyde aminotransferase
MNVHLGRETLEPAGRTEAQRLFHLEMLNAGYYLAPRGLAALSTPMTTSDLDGFVTSTTTVASEVLQGVNAGAARGR